MRMSLFTRKKPRTPGGSLRVQQPKWRGLMEHREQFLVLALAFLVLVAVVTKRFTPDSARNSMVDTEGYVRETVRAEFRFQSEDLEATRQAELAAEARVPDTYRVDQSLVQARLGRFQERVAAIEAKQSGAEAAIEQALRDSPADRPAGDVVREAVLSVAAGLAGAPPFEDVTEPEKLAPWLIPTPDTIPKRTIAVEEGQPPRVTGLEKPEPMHFAQTARLSDWGQKALEYTLNYGVLDPTTLADPARPNMTPEGEPRGIVVLRDHLIGAMQRSEEFARSEAPLLNTARRILLERIRTESEQSTGEATDATEDWSGLQNAAYGVALASVGETLVFDAVTTEGQQEAARRQVEPVTRFIAKNEPIQLSDQPWTEQSRHDYETYLAYRQSGQDQQRSILAAIGANMILVALILMALYKIMRLLRPESLATGSRDISLALLVMCGTLLVGRIASYFDPTGFIVPAAGGAVLLAILLNTRAATTTSLLTSVLLSIQYEYDWRLLVLSASMSLAGVLSIYKVRKRSDMGRAAANATLVGLLIVVAVTLSSDAFFAEAPRRLLLVAINGLFCLFMVPGLLQPLEHLFKITTDIQLLEYSDLNNEVLSRLAIEVPATYAHSLMLGQMAEAACESIGANGLLARVCAYYHDIGKLRRPEYFTENQTGTNVHDELSPRLSARAIASHVTEGAEMARECHLPKPIIDSIYEHHGTCKISFFYDQAKAQQKHGDVREEDFRYPGPRPQSRETAILMICDAVESAVRSLKNPNDERVRELVDKIISQRAEDRQFDECALTLKDLDTIAETVTKRVLSGLHRRISYPDEKLGRDVREANNVIPMPGGGES